MEDRLRGISQFTITSEHSLVNISQIIILCLTLMFLAALTRGIAPIIVGNHLVNILLKFRSIYQTSFTLNIIYITYLHIYKHIHIYVHI